jgi:predicted aspartyl protease
MKPVILVPAFINGKGPFEFALDPGASMTILSIELAERIGVKHGELKEGMGAGGKVQVVMSIIDYLAIGQAKRENLQIAITDLNPLSQAVGIKLDGVVGYNYLKNFKLTIDYPR